MSDDGFVFLIPAAILGLPAAIMAHNVWEVRHWPRVSGRVIGTGMRHMPYAKSAAKSFRPVIRYRYTVEGVEHESHVLYHEMEMGGSKPWAQKTLDRYPEGATVSVLHHPTQHEKACLDAKFGFFGWVLATLASVFILLAAAC